MSNNYHVVKNSSNGWSVKKDGAKRASATAPTQAQAYDIAKPLAQKNHSEVRIHGVDGKIRNSNSFGNDSCPPRDKKY